MDELHNYSLKAPTVYKKDWLMFHNAIFSDLKMSDCNDTITGDCVATETAEECADICKNDPNGLCFVGYFIQDGNKKFCVPLRTNLEKQTLYYERLRNKNFYPEFENASTTVFIRKNKSFPPNRANTVFYKDPFLLQNVETNQTIMPDDAGNVVSQIGEFFLRFLPHGIVLRDNEENYIPVEYDTKIIINIPQTNLNLEQEEDGHLLQWRKSSNTVGTHENVFYIRKLEKYFHGNSDSPWSLNYVSYDDKFYLETQLGSVLCLDAQNIPYLAYGSIDTLENKKYRFGLIPNITVYYEKDGECLSIPLMKTKMDGIEATYDGSICYRQPNCWRFGEPVDTEHRIIKMLLALLILGTIGVVIYLIWKYGRGKNRFV